MRPEVKALRRRYGAKGLPLEWMRWNNSTVPRMAQAILEEHRWGDAPILADALEEAGCDTYMVRVLRESDQTDQRWTEVPEIVRRIAQYAPQPDLAAENWRPTGKTGRRVYDGMPGVEYSRHNGYGYEERLWVYEDGSWEAD